MIKNILAIGVLKNMGVFIKSDKGKNLEDILAFVCSAKNITIYLEEFGPAFEKKQVDLTFTTLEECYIACNEVVKRYYPVAVGESQLGGYISGYLCDPEFTAEQFDETKKINLHRVGKSLEEESGNYFYHIIQSFPRGMRISYDEAHQCGVELAQRLGIYQAVIATHFLPWANKSGFLTGEKIRNHIIMNSHIFHEFVDENKPRKMKYHDDRGSYTQLKQLDEQIAADHEFPVREAEALAPYSWFGSKEFNEGKSWRQRVAIDIEQAKRNSTDLKSYIDAIIDAGYKLQAGNSKIHGRYITYLCPDGEKRVRDYTLGPNYTVRALVNYWKTGK